MVRANLGTDKSVPYKKLANSFNVLAVDFKIIKHGFNGFTRILRIHADLTDLHGFARIRSWEAHALS
ncbi:MAG: hypothetical protein FWG87_01385 [Defluviitaleaceae bacterium]|nr:hypothetical protein [Defluviitaleaceae bacterium]